ncbi:hypothetical protein HMPREF9520_03201 [Enterococcus faecalis TX1467]|nr:hypothetical protein HMPREF9520_03201 [Enterococcus faecalis TX1467]
MTLAKIVYASMTGNTEEIADIVAEAFEDLELRSKLMSVRKSMPLILKRPISV